MAKRKQTPTGTPEQPPNEAEQAADALGLTTDPQFLQFVEANRGLDIDPLSDLGLSLQAQYIKEVGDHPLDVLKTLIKNPFIKASDRINASKVLLEYGARKVPAQFEFSGRDGGPIKIDPTALARLSSKELDQLEKLLTKLVPSEPS